MLTNFKLVKSGNYLQAYEYAIANECIEKEQINHLHCFRSLLACVNNITHVPSHQFSWDSKDLDHNKTPLNYEKIDKSLLCHHQMFDELKKMCNK